MALTPPPLVVIVLVTYTIDIACTSSLSIRRVTFQGVKNDSGASEDDADPTGEGGCDVVVVRQRAASYCIEQPQHQSSTTTAENCSGAKNATSGYTSYLSPHFL